MQVSQERDITIQDIRDILAAKEPICVTLNEQYVYDSLFPGENLHLYQLLHRMQQGSSIMYEIKMSTEYDDGVDACYKMIRITEYN